MTVIRYTQTDLSRHPAQVFLMCLCLVSSAPTLLGAIPAPASIEEVLPPWLRQAWAGYLCVGAAVSLIGMYWRQRFWGMLIERVGLILVGGGSLLYCAAILSVVKFERGGGITASVLLGFAFMCYWRWRQIHKELKTQKEELTKLGELP